MNEVSKLLLVGCGGFIGSGTRYLVGGWVQSRMGATFPWATLLINVSGSLVIGLFMGLFLHLNWNPNWRLFFAIGILGGYTTFSTFSYEAIGLITEKSFSYAALYVVGSAFFGLTAAWIGLILARLLSGGHA